MTYSINTKLSDVYKNPVGHDVIHKLLLQMGVSDAMIMKIIGKLTLKGLRRFTKGFTGEGFIEAIIKLLNDAPEAAYLVSDESIRAWWKEAVFYQIYPRSFMDGNGDGVGDLRGVIQKLDYLKTLGVDAIWLCPVYDSPMDDNGYDIRDYHKIAEEFGDMETFDQLLFAVHERGMRLVMDLVVNHTSDEHEWFVHALQNENSPYRDYYFFSHMANPNNWTSFFGGGAWNYYSDADIWALHLFSKKQVDLNWDYGPLRQRIYSMMRWWLRKGVDGFRLDVVNYISKAPNLPNGSEFVGKLMGYTGIEHYFHGPNLHKYLAEMRREVFEPYNAFSVGEAPGAGREISKLMTHPLRGELDMAFCFDVLEPPGKERFSAYVYNPLYLKQYFSDWMRNYADSCQMAIFFNNHDNPRMLSKIDPEGDYRSIVAKMLAMLQLTLKGTPFIYQGDELGAINFPFKSIADMRDVESLNFYRQYCETMPSDEAFAKVLSGSRDHARVPMQWNADQNSGFTEGAPWIVCAHDEYNADNEVKKEDSVFWFYKDLIAIRKHGEALIYGDIEIIKTDPKPVFAYYRSLGEEKWLIVINLSEKEQALPPVDGFELVLCNYGDTERIILLPYEAILYQKIKR